MRRYPVFKQVEWMDCGATCLQMIAKYYGRTMSRKSVKEVCNTTREGISILDLKHGAEAIGFIVTAVEIGFDALVESDFVPFIAHFNQNHFIVVYKISKSTVTFADPAHGMLTLSRMEFVTRWSKSDDDDNQQGVVLFLEATESFLDNADENDPSIGQFRGLFAYLSPYKRWIAKILTLLLLSSVLLFVIPFLTQALVDTGIRYKNKQFVILILAGQLIFFAGRTSIEFLRNWILLHIGTRVSVKLISNFLTKLMRLPISFFDTKFTGDLLQRINDHNKVQEFLTSTSLSAIFSTINILIFAGVIAYYSLPTFLLFCVGTLVYLLWVNYFLRKRKKLDYLLFQARSLEQGNIVEMINTMRDIKLYDLEANKMADWEVVQKRLLNNKINNLSLSQFQVGGASAINEIKNILILFLTATQVINGQLTLGAMLAIQYIIGQLNFLVSDLVRAVNQYQDALWSYARLHEIYEIGDEITDVTKLKQLPQNKTITFKNISFKYPGAIQEVLKNISFTIPAGSTTAIVGESGGGKSTILKLLLKFYDPTSGDIMIDNINFLELDHKAWRKKCGVVLQDNYIFTDSIAMNITLGDTHPDSTRLEKACDLANILPFVHSLSLKFNTVIGAEGVTISEGQKQRILLARIFYNDPEVVLLDEATNALDSINENIILENLETFLKGKTVIIVAHRLSTIRSADQILVISNGQIAESGNHETLLQRKDIYYQLVRKQLEQN